MVVIALDKAHILHDKPSHERPYSQAAVLLWTIKEYSGDDQKPVWVVFASTTSKVAHLASP